MKIVGIGGLPRSGKDSLAELFIEEGYFGISGGDIIREYSRQRHCNKPDPISVANMTETSNWLRENRGPDFLLKDALKQFEAINISGPARRGLVIWSVRAPAEVDFILNQSGELIWIEANEKIRYERMLAHLRVGEKKLSFEEFTAQEKLQWQPQPNIPKEVQMNISYVKSHATYTLDNSGNDFDNFLKQARKLINNLEAKA